MTGGPYAHRFRTLPSGDVQCAACRDAATTEQDRCRWDIRWHAHFVNSGRVAPVTPPKSLKARPEQMSMF